MVMNQGLYFILSLTYRPAEIHDLLLHYRIAPIRYDSYCISVYFVISICLLIRCKQRKSIEKMVVK